MVQIAQRVGGHDGTVAIGYANLLAGKPEEALLALTSTRESARDAALWSDIAAAHAGMAEATSIEDHWLAALAALDRALVLNGNHVEARFNKAMVTGKLGAHPIAHKAWQGVLAAESSALWKRAGRRHLSSIPTNDSEAWRAATKDIERLPAIRIAQLTRLYPQQARTYGEGPYLSSWADAMIRKDEGEARAYVERARVIAETLRSRSGESLLFDAVGAIGRSPESAALIEAHRMYRQGRVSYLNGNLAAAEHELGAAALAFGRGHSPMEAAARFYVASVRLDQSRVAEAYETLKGLLATEMRIGTHKALLSRILHQLALCHAVRGHWSDSLTAARQSMQLAQTLGERGSAAEAEAVLSEDYDFLGQPELARRHGLSALRGACANGDLNRARVVLAALSRTELRGGRWSWAHALLGLEATLAVSQPVPLLDADMFLSQAGAAARLHGRAASAAALSQARAAAQRVTDPLLRRRVHADIDGVEGALVRRENPRAALTLLDSAIEFQRDVVRPILLPELYLERGQAHLVLGSLDDAERDFDAGIRELERQRTTVRVAELRPGIFDDAEELFHEATTLQLRRGADAAKVFGYIERGRARTLLEQIEGTDSPAVVSLTGVQRNLPGDTALVEYVCLPDRMAVLVITSERVAVHTRAISRRDAMGLASDFVRVLSPEANLRQVLSISARLYEHLVTPILPDLRKVSTMIVVADDVLQRLPFAALFDDRSQSFLIERFIIRSVPSASIYTSLAERRRMRGRTLDALAFGNPSVSRAAFPTLVSLDWAEQEARKVGSMYDSSSILTRDAATVERFLTLAPVHDVVHFSGHAVIRRRDPVNSGLICAASENDEGVLTSSRIARLHFDRTSLVVLAACSTMRGRNAAIEGVSSIAHAFLIAGVPAVIGTLWDIEDRDAAPFVTGIHRRVAGGIQPAVALREAQIDAIRSAHEAMRHPARWGAFMVMGVDP